MELTQQYLKEILEYNPETGIFKWKIDKSKKCKKDTIAGSYYNHGYQIIKIDRKRYLSHRLAFLYIIGNMPKEVDHINHDRADNRWINLKAVNHFINMKNQLMYKNNKTKITGVHYDKKWQKWKSYISNKQRINLYWGDDFFEACCARKSAESKYGFHPNHGSKQ